MTEYKRQYREIPDETKQKISQTSKGKKKSEWHKEHIRQAMLDYWQTVPHRPDSNDEKNNNSNNNEKP
ncbi:MAG: hypothetical protein IKZ50_04520 [Bacteroidales bacterium]|nr:hypothetical protein [Bacteroidales bacterium]